jgi:phage terminase large subunit
LNGIQTHRHGLDFGFENDPCALMSVAYDAKKKTLYIYGEWVKHGQFEEAIFEEIKRRGLINKVVNADSAERKAIERLNALGARKVTKCWKAPNYVEDGLHWLRALRAIIIDPVKCPVAVKEWTRYEFKRTRSGDLTNQYVDANNHTIDAVRYALESEIRYGDALHKWGM